MTEPGLRPRNPGVFPGPWALIAVIRACRRRARGVRTNGDRLARSPAAPASAKTNRSPARSATPSWTRPRTARSERPVDFVHVVRDVESPPHWDELREVAAQLSRARLHLFVTRTRPDNVTVEHPPGRPDSTLSARILTDPASAEIHICGSTPFVTDMRAVVQAAGVPAHPIRYDASHSPRTVDTPGPAPHPGPFQVSYQPLGATAQWTPSREHASNWRSPRA